MVDFDIGVSLAFWLTIVSTLMCVAYGAYRWNKDGEVEENLSEWITEEKKINEDL